MLLVGDLVKKYQPALFWCMRGLPKAKREALYTLFAFCRHIDTVSRSSMPIAEKKELLKAWNEELNNIYDKQIPTTNISRKIYKNCLRFNLPKDMWQEILQSASLNIPTPLQAPSRLIFEQYLNGTAIVPFELSMLIIDAKHTTVATELAKNLGRALMVTLMLRYAKDEAKNERLYFPQDVLERANIFTKKPMQIIESPDFAYARQLLAGEAELAYLKVERLLSKMPQHSTLALRYIKNVGLCLFEKMQKRGWEIISPKPKLNFATYIAILWRTLFR